jgi:hypothetical protein
MISGLSWRPRRRRARSCCRSHSGDQRWSAPSQRHTRRSAEQTVVFGYYYRLGEGAISGRNTAKTLYRKFETNIPRKGTVQPQSQFLLSCFCERFIYSHDRSAYSAARK